MRPPIEDCTGDYWPEPLRALTQEQHGDEAVVIAAAGDVTGRHYDTILPAEAWQQIRITPWRPDLRGDGLQFRLALEAERLRLAHACDPLMATNNAAVHLLPHQLEAVYDVMLPQPVIRHLMAHDAGAGKTVMCGLLHKELRVRQPDLRTLIVAPAALTVQWQRELADKFLEPFQVIDGDALRRHPEAWVDTRQAITSVSFASQPEIRATLAAVNWDLVIVDEAHHMAAYEKHQTQAYELGTILSRRAKHLVLATATPHKGDAVNFLKLLQLLDPGITDASVVRAPGRPGTPMMWRRLKEEMVGFDGQPLFKRREVKTHWYLLADSPAEMALYEALTQYVSRTYRAAEKVGGRTRVNVQFAMTILQRRMGSSLEALEQSLRRRRLALQRPVVDGAQGTLGYSEDAPESERWEVEACAETASPARTRREREKEMAEIGTLLEAVENVRRQGPEAKVTKLQNVMVEAGVEPGNSERLLVFTEFLDTLVFLRRLFEDWGYTVTQIDGSMPTADRRRAEREFQDRCQVMVATEAAGEGINLQFCARMVNCDLPWVPTRLEQRMGRIHRYGQKRVARIYNLVAGDTREGYVLKGLMDRLDTMRQQLGDQVFDVVSLLVVDADLEALLTRVSLAPAEKAPQYQVLQDLVSATAKGEERYREWAAKNKPLSPSDYDAIRQASRQFRLTPEYAQHLMVDALFALGETPSSWPAGKEDPGDADAFVVTTQRKLTAECLAVRRGDSTLFTFSPDVAEQTPRARLLAVGTPVFDRLLDLVREQWGHSLAQGSVFWDPSLPPEDGYLLWFLSGCVRDGHGQTVVQQLFGVRQDAHALQAAPTFSLTDLVPATGHPPVPAWMQALTRDPLVVWEWCVARQQLPWLREGTCHRKRTTGLRRAALLGEARQALATAEQAHQDAVWFSSADADETEAYLLRAERRVRELTDRLAHEEACSLAYPQFVGVAAVLPMTGSPPEEELADSRPEVAQAAMAAAEHYEREYGRQPVDVTGEHEHYPYDLHSVGPGGPRCIEVKGTTTGRFIMSENERRAAKRLGTAYYLYVVSEPLTKPEVNIIRNPYARLQPDEVLTSGVRYSFDRATWTAATDEKWTP
jgi:superfamily II DNA or RNA helicase